MGPAGAPDDPAGVSGGEAAAAHASPRLALDGFDGKLERLLALARAERIDLAGLPLNTLLDQVSAALRQEAPLAAKGDWIVMAAWLLLLRSRRLIPPEAPGRRAVEDAPPPSARALEWREMRALAAWLEHRPWPGHDVFCRGQAAADADIAISDMPIPDIIEFLWASLALFDDTAPAIAAARDPPPPPPPAWPGIAAARERISRLLAAPPDGHPPGGFPLAALLPPAPMAPATRAARGIEHAGAARWWRSAWASTFVASLELARQRSVTLTQDSLFGAIRVRAASPSVAGASIDDSSTGVTLPSAPGHRREH